MTGKLKRQSFVAIRIRLLSEGIEPGVCRFPACAQNSERGAGLREKVQLIIQPDGDRSVCQTGDCILRHMDGLSVILQLDVGEFLDVRLARWEQLDSGSTGMNNLLGEQG